MRTKMRVCAKRIGLALSLACLVAAPRVAWADDDASDCEPGSWFCGEEPGDGELEPLPSEPAPAAKPDPKPATRPAPPVVVYQPAAPTVVVREAPPAYKHTPRRPPRKQEWGLNLHLGGAMIGSGRDGNASMGLGGLGLRFRPIPYIALEADLDFANGRDFNGFRRNETAFTLSGLVFLNPKNVTQVYMLGGFGWSGAHATDDRYGFDRMEYEYGYFGAHAGLGLEFRLSKLIALNVDLQGLVRGRVDDNRRAYPEFVSSDGRSTNTSGAGLFRMGLTFYW